MAQTSLAKTPAESRAPDHDFDGSDYAPRAGYGPAAKNAESPVPLWQRAPVVVLRRTVLEPRLALVAAMAFFSISLTLNLMGIQLGGLHASNLSPNGVRRMIARRYADANARVVRYYENLRVVYEVEARVQQVRRASEAQPAPEPPKKPRKQSFNFHPHSRRNAPELEERQARYSAIEKELRAGPAISALAPAYGGAPMEAEMRQILQQERQWA